MTWRWDWEGHYGCPECGEEISWQREDGFPDTWVMQIVHDHDGDKPQWRAALYRAAHKRRLAPEVREIRDLALEQRRAARG